MRRTVLILFAIVSLGFAPAPFLPRKLTADEAELNALQGEWEEIRVLVGHSKGVGEIGFRHTFTIAGRYITYRYRGEVTTRHEIVRIDPKTNPKRLELRTVEGHSDPRQRLVFKLEGDKLTACYNLRTPTDYPPDFSCRYGAYLTVSRRKKP